MPVFKKQIQNPKSKIGLGLLSTVVALSLSPFAHAAQASAAAQSNGANEASETNQANEAASPEVQEAVSFTQKLTNNANKAFLETSEESQQLANFQEVLNEGLALDFLGRFMLGSARNDISPEQQERYDAVFPSYITQLYAEQFKGIAGRELTINDATAFGRRDVIVRTRFFRDDGTPVNVDWRARKLRADGHKMIDIIVSGVSIMTVKREEFSSFIGANGIDALITRLEQETS